MPAPLYKIMIEALEVEAIIGILPHERTQPQRILCECELLYRPRERRYLDYAAVAETIEETLQQHRFELLEEALEEIVAKIGRTYPDLESVRLKLTKPDILPHARVGVECLRTF